jgi:hypothetical protein
MPFDRIHGQTGSPQTYLTGPQSSQIPPEFDREESKLLGSKVSESELERVVVYLLVSPKQVQC